VNRSAPLARSAPLQRHKRMRRGPSRRSLNRTLAAALYVRWVHGRPCVLDAAHACAGPIQQSHGRNLDGPTGMGRKESDFDSVPMCRGCHEQWEQYKGAFAGWTREQRRLWMQAQIVIEHAEFELSGGVLP
jgi:hypothetical protein